MIMEMRMEGRDRAGLPLIGTARVPDQASRDNAKRLVTQAFAPHLAPLIDIGFNAAYSSEIANATLLEEQGLFIIEPNCLFYIINTKENNL